MQGFQRKHRQACVLLVLVSFAILISAGCKYSFISYDCCHYHEKDSSFAGLRRQGKKNKTFWPKSILFWEWSSLIIAHSIGRWCSGKCLFCNTFSTTPVHKPVSKAIQSFSLFSLKSMSLRPGEMTSSLESSQVSDQCS